MIKSLRNRSMRSWRWWSPSSRRTSQRSMEHVSTFMFSSKTIRNWSNRFSREMPAVPKTLELQSVPTTPRKPWLNKIKSWSQPISNWRESLRPTACQEVTPKSTCTSSLRSARDISKPVLTKQFTGDRQSSIPKMNYWYIEIKKSGLMIKMLILNRNQV